MNTLERKKNIGKVDVPNVIVMDFIMVEDMIQMRIIVKKMILLKW